MKWPSRDGFLFRSVTDWLAPVAPPVPVAPPRPVVPAAPLSLVAGVEEQATTDSSDRSLNGRIKNEIMRIRLAGEWALIHCGPVISIGAPASRSGRRQSTSTRVFVLAIATLGVACGGAGNQGPIQACKPPSAIDQPAAKLSQS